MAVAVAVALLLSFAGVLGGFGYHVRLLKITFDLSGGVYAVVEATYNPLLHPFNWLVNRGSLIAEFNGMMVGSSVRAGYITAEDYLATFALDLAVWDSLESLVILLLVTIAIEVVEERLLYLVLFAGVVGFLAGIIGTAIGLAAGAVFFLIYKFKLGNENIFARFWDYFWEKEDA